MYFKLAFTESTVSEVTYRYDSLFTPAGYAFSIWGVIYASFLIYSIAQLLPVHKNDVIYDKLSLPFILVNLLCVTWINVFSNNLIGYSVGIIAAMLFFGGILFGKAKEAYLYEGNNFWLTVPFSLFLGWVSVASIANVSLLLISMNWRGGTLGESTWTIMMISATLLLITAISIAYRDFIYPLVAGWGCIAIGINQAGNHKQVANVALIAGIVLTLWSVGYAIWHFRNSRLVSGRYRSHIDA
ncbi:MAG: hypothetical protein EOP56_16015 [Sphingobacteriales bacterium]|nr:MAG: hypothetical protein EOP56_16015 [Sphingobacteriales bacterium]